MKKIVLIMLTLVLILSLASCNKKNTTQAPAQNQNVDLSDPTLSINKVYTVPYQYDLAPYIDISRDDYIGIEVERIDTTVTEEDVNNAIFADLAEHSTFVDTDRACELGDQINIDFTGSMNGIEFDGGAAEAQELILGEGGFIPGFEDAIVGHTAGEEFVIDVTFPEDYRKEDLKGQQAQFKIKLNSVKEQIYPEFTEEFIKDKYGCDTVEEYLSNLKERLVIEKAEEADSERRYNAYESIYEKVEFKDHPENELKKHYEFFVNMYKSQAEMYGVAFGTFITDYLGTTEDEFYEYATSYAIVSVEEEMIFFYIATKENLWQGLVKGDYDKYIAEAAAESSTTVAELEASYGVDGMWKSLIMEKTIDFVLKNSVEVEPKVESEPTTEATEE